MCHGCVAFFVHALLLIWVFLPPCECAARLGVHACVVREQLCMLAFTCMCNKVLSPKSRGGGAITLCICMAVWFACIHSAGRRP